MKTQRLTALGIIAIALVAIAVFLYGNIAKAVGGSFAQGQKFYLTAGTGTNTDAGERSATTTNVYLATTATASSTITGSLERGDRIDLTIRAVASSSLSRLRWTIDTSPDAIDWYPFQAATTTPHSDPNYTFSTGDVKQVWSLATTSTDSICGTNEVCKHVYYDNVIGKYFRIRFDVTGGNAAVWAAAQVAEPTPN